MKKLLSTIMLASAVVLAGCNKEPTVEQMTELGTASGYTAAYVLDKQVKVEAEVRNGIIDVMNEVQKFIPQTNETYTAAWTPVVKSFLDTLKDKDGKPLPEATKEYILKDFGYVTSLLDQWIDKKGIRTEKNLTDAFVNAFFDSFLTNFKPANLMGAAKRDEEHKIDKLTEEILEELLKK